MHLLPAAIAAFLSLDLALASAVLQHKPRFPNYTVKETHIVPRGWSEVGEPHPDQILDIKIGIKNKRFAELERHLYEISDPSHHRYREHFSKEEVDNLVRPAESVSDLVNEWLVQHGIEPWQCKYSSGKDWISLALPVSHVEKLLDTKYSVYEHEDGTSMIRTTKWSLPEYLHEHISTIQPTTAFLRASPKIATVIKSPGVDLDMEDYPPSQSDLNSVCNFEGVTPLCLRTLYGTVDYVPRSKDSHVAFTNYLGEVANRSDTEIFLNQFRPEAAASARSYEQISIDGGKIDNGSSGAGYEGNLDIETIAGLVWPINITSYATGGSPPFNPDINTPSNTNEPYLTWLDYVLGKDSLPQTVSTSYGDDEQSVPASYAQTVCEGFAQLGLRGVSLLFSSGDNGVGANGTCISNDGKNTTTFLPSFPASCPYITAVGGTRNFPEVVAYDTKNGYVSGSGFSNYFAQPAYQKDSGVVDKYVKSLSGTNDGLYNKTGRAYPDVAAQGYRYVTIYGGKVVSLDGTSASSPTTASIFALVNDALLAAGEKPLGFLNPWLYSGAGAHAFTDVVAGSSTGCDGPGFAAGAGWDAASGWGTPQFPTILEILGLNSTSS